MLISRRGILRGLFAAPAIVAASSLMQISGVALARPDPTWGIYSGYDILLPPGFLLASEWVMNEMNAIVAIERAPNSYPTHRSSHG